MKKYVIAAVSLLFAANVHAAGQSLDGVVPCSGGGSITITGDYDIATAALNARLEAAECVDNDKTINGVAVVHGALPMNPGGMVDITITMSDVSVAQNYSYDQGSVSGSATLICSGDYYITGSLAADRSVDLRWTSNATCQGAGNHHAPLDDFLDDLVFFRLALSR